MDPFMFALLVAWFLVKDTAVDGFALAKGQTPPRHAERMANRAQAHQAREAARQRRHERAMANGHPTIGGAVAERIRKGPKSRDDMGPIRAWWWDLCDDTSRRLTEERRKRHERTANGEQDWQKARDWAWRQAQAWRERNKDRGAAPDQQPPTVQADSVRTDWPDPNTPDPGVQDAEVVDEPGPQRPRAFAELTEDSCRWGYAVADPDGRTRVEVCRDHDQAVEDAERSDGSWLPFGGTSEVYPVVYEHPDLGWVLAGTGNPLPERTSPLMVENPPTTVRAVAERIPEVPGGSPADESTQGETMSQPVPIQGATGVALTEASASMTAGNAVSLFSAAQVMFQQASQLFTEAVADLSGDKGVSGPLLGEAHAIQSDLESAVNHAGNARRIAAEHEAEAAAYRDYQQNSGSGDAKKYAELH